MFPDKEARQTCWAHKDSYWACLDEGKTLEQCAELRKQYEKFCPNQWVIISFFFQKYLSNLIYYCQKTFLISIGLMFHAGEAL